jgi:hemin uptake protein HemP
MTPPAKKVVKTPKSPYDSPSSPIASAKKVIAKPVRRLIKEEIAKPTKPVVETTRDVKSETLFSPAYKIEALDENHHRPSTDSNIMKVDEPVAPEVEIQPTSCAVAQVSVEEDCEDEFDPFLFIKNLPPLPIDSKPRKALLPKRVRGTPPICLALDLDETLVHCSIQPIERAELTFSVAFNGTEYKVYVRMRPYLA